MARQENKRTFFFAVILLIFQTVQSEVRLFTPKGKIKVSHHLIQSENTIAARLDKDGYFLVLFNSPLSKMELNTLEENGIHPFSVFDASEEAVIYMVKIYGNSRRAAGFLKMKPKFVNILEYAEDFKYSNELEDTLKTGNKKGEALVFIECHEDISFRECERELSSIGIDSMHLDFNERNCLAPSCQQRTLRRALYAFPDTNTEIPWTSPINNFHGVKVAGIAAGNGWRSLDAGGDTLKWRCVAPKSQIISRPTRNDEQYGAGNNGIYPTWGTPLGYYSIQSSSKNSIAVGSINSGDTVLACNLARRVHGAGVKVFLDRKRAISADDSVAFEFRMLDTNDVGGLFDHARFPVIALDVWGIDTAGPNFRTQDCNRVPAQTAGGGFYLYKGEPDDLGSKANGIISC